MKKSVIIIVFIAFISTKLAAQSVGLGNTDPEVFSKFRIPETNLSSLWFTSNLDFNSNKSIGSETYNDIIDIFPKNTNNSSLSSQFNYSLTPTYYLLKQNDDKWLTISSSLGGNLKYSYQDQKNQDTTFSQTKDNVYDLSLNLQGSYGRYLSPGNLFYTIGSNINVDIYTEYNNIFLFNNHYNNYIGKKSQHYNLYFGIGWGKIRDVTPVVSAIRFQERLKQINLLNNDLSNNTIEELSEQFSKKDYYTAIHDRPDKFFWQDIGKTLMNDGITLSGLNEYGSYYLSEVLNEVRLRRNEGITTGLNITADYNNNVLPASGYINPEQFNLLANVYFNLSHQLNLNSQVRFNLSLSGGPNVIKNSYNRQQYLIQSTLGYDYEITDKIVTSVSDEFYYSLNNYNYQAINLSNYLNINVNYFLEDNYSLGVGYQFGYSDSRNNSSTLFYSWTSFNSSHVSNSISVGFTYYINRGFLYN